MIADTSVGTTLASPSSTQTALPSYLIAMSATGPSPSAADSFHPPCLTVLGLMPPVTAEDVKQAYRAKAMAMHPDRGGDPAQFILLQKAFDEANDFVKFKAGKLEWLGAKIEAYAQQQEVVTEAIERGGEVGMEDSDFLLKSFGEDFAHVADRLVMLRLHGPRADDVFAILLGFRAESLKDLATLDLRGGSITDEGLLQLKELKALRSLDLRGTAVGKVAVEIPQWFERLEFLGLPKGALSMFARLALPRRIRLVMGDGTETT